MVTNPLFRAESARTLRILTAVLALIILGSLGILLIATKDSGVDNFVLDVQNHQKVISPIPASKQPAEVTTAQ